MTQNFFVDSKASLSVPFMTKTDDFYYSESSELEAKILRLPYKVCPFHTSLIQLDYFYFYLSIYVRLIYSKRQGYKFAMYIILPNKRDGLNELISRIDSSSLHRTQILMDKVEVKVSLPKFKFANTVKLNDFLKAVSIF